MSVKEDLSAVNASETSDGGNTDRDKALVLSFRVVWLMILSKAAIPQDYIHHYIPINPHMFKTLKLMSCPMLFLKGQLTKRGRSWTNRCFFFFPPLNEV